jgi:hypothetical protein
VCVVTFARQRCIESSTFWKSQGKRYQLRRQKKNTPTFLSSSAGAFSVPAIIRFRPITGDRIRLLHRPLQLLELPVALCRTRRLTTLHVAALPSSGLSAAVDVLEGPGTSWRDGRGRACSDLGWGRARRPGPSSLILASTDTHEVHPCIVRYHTAELKIERDLFNLSREVFRNLPQLVKRITVLT